jgi:hypothetical protein
MTVHDCKEISNNSVGRAKPKPTTNRAKPLLCCKALTGSELRTGVVDMPQKVEQPSEIDPEPRTIAHDAKLYQYQYRV